MKPTGLAYEFWDSVPRYVVRLEADDEGARITCGKLGSHVVWIAIMPQYEGTTPPSQEQLEGMMDGMNNLAPWISPVKDQPNAYLLHKGVRAIFQDNGIRTHNGFPQPHIEGPAIFRDESLPKQEA